MTRQYSWASRGVIAAAILVLAVIGYLLLWTTYMVYDDEGYVLYSLRTFAEHGHLYDQVYTQYGPFFFVLYRALHAVGLLFTNTTARALALVCWIGAVTACGGLVWRATGGRVFAAIATTVAVFVHLLPMSSEPSHPGGLITLLVALVAWYVTGMLPAATVPFPVGPRLRATDSASKSAVDRAPSPRATSASRRRAAAVGVVGAMLVLTKINVGILLFVGAGAWWLLNIPSLARRAWTKWAIAAAAAAVPMVLMGGSLHEPWIRVFIAVTASGAAAAVLASTRTRSTDVAATDWLPATIGAVVVAALTITVTLASGTTFSEILEGVILGPLRHPSLYWVPLTWRVGAAWLALAAVPAVIWLARMPVAKRRAWIIGGRFALIAAYAVCLADLLPFSPAAFVMSYGLSTCWLFVLPIRDEDTNAATRSWLALLLVMQALHAFPVAGSQISWGTFLWVPLAVLGAADGVVLLKSSIARTTAVALIAAGCAALAINLGANAWARYRGSDDLAVRGAEHLRLPENYTSGVRMLVRNSQVHADMLFSLPGMMSFNAWTGLPPPTTQNATHWFNLLSLEQQDAILQRLEGDPHAALVVQRYVYNLVDSQHFIHHTPLLDWLQNNYRPAFKVETYEFWVPKSRTIEPVNAARLFVGAPGSVLRYKLQITTAPVHPIDIARLQLRVFSGDGSIPVAVLDSKNSRFFSVPIAASGDQRGQFVESALPLSANGLLRIEVFTNDVPELFQSHGGIVYLLDRNGRRVGEARLID